MNLLIFGLSKPCLEHIVLLLLARFNLSWTIRVAVNFILSPILGIILLRMKVTVLLRENGLSYLDLTMGIALAHKPTIYGKVLLN